MIDTHAHLQDEKIQNIKVVIQDSLCAGVSAIICASSDIETSKKSVELANGYDAVYATVGVHPHDAKTFNEDTINKLQVLAKNKKVVAIGEIGLDYYYNFSSREEQRTAFIQQIDLAYKLKLPIVIHSREATGDVMEIIRANLKKLKYGVCIHCFNMSLEILKEIMNYGFYISIGGLVTFKNASNILNVVKECDSDKLMLETDCPYLTPVPYRSEINEPKYLVYIAEKIAEIKGISVKEVDELTTKNAKRFFGIK